MAGKGLDAEVTITGLNETLRAFNRYGKDANRELRQAAGGIADEVVPALVLAAQTSSPQAALVAPSIKRRADRVPKIVAGGTTRVKPSRGSTRSFNTRPKKLSNRVTAGDILFGSEFGGGRRPTTHQFPPWVGKHGYWFYPTLRRHLPRLRRAYIKTLDDLAAKWAQGGDEPGG